MTRWNLRWYQTAIGHNGLGKCAEIKAAPRSAEIETVIPDSDISCDESIHEKTATQSYKRLTEITDETLAVATDDDSEPTACNNPKDLWCDLCYSDKGDMIQAYGFCSECGNHRKWPALQKHKILQGGQISKPQSYKPVKYLDCTTHSGSVKDHYCTEHDEFICRECIQHMHQSCKTSPLSKTSSVINVIAVKHFLSVVDDLKNGSLLAKSAFERYVSDIENQKQDLIKHAKEERDKIVYQAEKLCKNTVSMISAVCRQQKAYSTEKVMALENIILSLDETNTDIKGKLNVKFDQNVITRMQQINEQVREYNSEIENMNKQNRNISLSFSPSSAVSTFLSVSKYLGDVRGLSQRSDLSEISVNKGSSLDMRLKQDKNTCDTGGMAVTSKGVLLTSDWKNNSVKAFSQDNKLLSCLTFSDSTYGIGVIDDQTAAVSTYDNKLHILNISDPANISIDRSLSLGYWVSPKTQYKGNLIVTKFDEPKCVKMIDLNGEEKWSVSVDHKGQQLFDKPYSATISTCNDTSTVIVSDWGKDTLTLIVPDDGHLIKTIDVKGKEPHGLTSDNDGYVYVCYFRTKEICVLSPDFEKSRILLAGSDLRGKPNNIVYCGNSDVLYIGYLHNDTVDCFRLA